MAIWNDHDLCEMCGNMAKLAAEVRVDGTRRLRLCGRVNRIIRSLPARMAKLENGEESRSLTALRESARVMEKCACQAKAEGGARLPSAAGTPRVLILARKLCFSSVETGQDIAQAVRAFDEVQNLTMTEIWSVPEAMRVALSEAYAETAVSLLDALSEEQAAENWVYAGGKSAPHASPEFFQRALQMALEAEKPDLRRELEDMLARHDLTPEGCVRLSCERQASARIRTERLLTLCRAIDQVNWLREFEEISTAEQTLRQDPAGVYPAMTDDSRGYVRDELSRLAARFRMGETALARFAVRAAEEASEEIRRSAVWWLYDDEGRRALAEKLGIRKPPLRFPDPHGIRFILLSVSLTLLILLSFRRLGISFWWAILLFAPGMRLSVFLICQVLTRILRPRAMLRMKITRLSEENAALVVIPALLTSEKRAEELAEQLETLGCLEDDAHLDFALLGDLKDSPHERQAEDEAILTAAREAVARLNRGKDRAKYHFLYRARAYAPSDRLWRGYARKRGALMALGKLLNGQDDGSIAGADALLAGRFRYVVTLDADTRMLPGTVHALIGNMAHPLNARRRTSGGWRGFSVLQPGVELDAKECRNGFVRLMAGSGGMSAYSGMVSDLFYDLTGRGSYCGKAAIDMRHFIGELDGRLDDGRILSHDLIEGMLSGCGKVSDISFFDGFPRDYPRYLTRLSRWTRGDWQLLPELFRKDISFFDRFRLFLNLLEGLREPALFLTLICAMYRTDSAAFSAGLLLTCLPALIGGLLGDRDAFRRGCVELMALPAAAYAKAEAVAKALYRVFVSKRNLLDWVTSADASGSGRSLKIVQRAGAILTLPGLFSPQWLLPAVSLGALFFIAPSYLSQLTEETPEPALTLRDVSMLTSLARDTWGFFDRYVVREGHYLPPDNVQIDPDRGAAWRTSPTNIAMYLLSILSAGELGLIDHEERDRRMGDTTDTLEKMEKWKGHLYNWYDIRTLSPLMPRYVSSVDSGNLAAALLLCASALEGTPLAPRMNNLARKMDFRAVYDAQARLFFIGFDAQNDRMSASHYDLLASEARILSYTAMMLGQVSTEHWKSLGRPVSGDTLMSWTGTLFEYLMPALLMRSAPGTLLGKSCQGAVRVQMRHGKNRGRPWGVSESGYSILDLNGNYQYRAFGMRELSMSGSVPQDVVAPYAACLALSQRPADAARNIAEMIQMGWKGEYGLYEAADCFRKEARLVKSWMSHHQGMALCALCNALTGDKLVSYFMRIPQARALELLLNEKTVSRVRLSAPPASQNTPKRANRIGEARPGRPNTRLLDSTLLGGGGACALVTARGDIVYRKDGLYAQRFMGNLLMRRDGMRTLLGCPDDNWEIMLNSPHARSRFAPGEAAFDGESRGINWEMRLGISPRSGALIKFITLRNRTRSAVQLRVLDAFEVAFMREEEMRAHPAFFRLFCRADLTREGAIVYRRTPRNPLEEYPALYHRFSGACHRETDWSFLFDREEKCLWRFRGEDGAQTDPASALCAEVLLKPGEERALRFDVGFCTEEMLEDELEKSLSLSGAQEEMRLAGSTAISLAHFASLNDVQRSLMERLAVFLWDPRLPHREGRGECSANPGIPTACPSVLVTLTRPEDLTVLRDAVRMHGFMRGMGLRFHLAVLDAYGGGYRQTVRDSAQDLIASCGLRELIGAPDGVTVLSAQSMTASQRQALSRVCALCYDGKTDFWAQTRRALMSLEIPARADGKRAGRPSGERRTFLPGTLTEEGYLFEVGSGELPEAPWSNILATDGIGALITERGGGYFWHKNSRLNRLTGFDNDPHQEGWGLLLYASDEETGSVLPLLPGPHPAVRYRVCHALHFSRFSCEAESLFCETTLFADREKDEIRIQVRIADRGARARNVTVTAFVDWLMGTDGADSARTRSWFSGGGLYAVGATEGAVGYLGASPEAEGGQERGAFLGHGGSDCPDGISDSKSGGGNTLRTRLRVPSSESVQTCFSLGCAPDLTSAEKAVRTLREEEHIPQERQARFSLRTGDDALDTFANGFLVKQALDGRMLARTGLYQSGGAYGFRDQLQDALSILEIEPERVREHIVRCAGHQFAAGDVMHWWHEPAFGVRTRITDDMLFLPFAAARYVRSTGDRAILIQSIPYLAGEVIPDGREDWYGAARTSEETGSLHEHCMRAFKRAYRKGAHGLLLMGSGDWNDGMNRVGEKGIGESVWLSLFFAVCAREYAAILKEGEEKDWLLKACEEQKSAVEKSGWDGEWFLRAYDDDGKPVGARGNASCEIDLLAQCWAVFAHLDRAKCAPALRSAGQRLFDRENGIIRLLTPPFSPDDRAGYLCAYPAGVRENGGQYTHAACWYLIALAMMGEAEQAKEVLHALLPMNRAGTPEEAKRYRVEPYVLAGDIYSEGSRTGRGGWTWYTGAAGWLLTALKVLAGYQREGNRVRLNALKGVWERPEVNVMAGNTPYRLISDKRTACLILDGMPLEGEWLELTDDGKAHTCLFPQRENAIIDKREMS